jgi:hypothetical protein
VACALLGPGCSAEEPADAPPRTSDPTDAADATGAAAPARSPERPDRALAPGRIELSVRGQRVTLACRDADARELLSELAETLEFALETSTAALPPVTARVVDAPVAEALPVILTGVRYEAEFEAVGPVHRLVRLRIVGPAEDTVAAPSTSLPGRVDQRVREAVRRYRETGALPRSGERDADDDFDDEDEDEELDQARLIERLADRDPRVRADAAFDVEPEGRGLDALLALVYDDPDSNVRITAVRQLEDSDAHSAVEGLIHALRDRDRRVVLEAIDALEFAGDESVIPSLEPLLDSRDEEIRTAAEEAIEFLE